MKYWKGKTGTSKEGQIGTMDDNAFVPDSYEVTRGEYNSRKASIQIPITNIYQIILKNKKSGMIYLNVGIDLDTEVGKAIDGICDIFLDMNIDLEKTKIKK